MRRLETVRQAWKFLAVVNLFWRVHQVGRTLLVPFYRLVDYLPERGVLLDLGCGHGVFLALAKAVKPDLQLIGLDLSIEKIETARQAFDALKNGRAQLAACDMSNCPEQSVDVISIIDVLYLVPLDKWDSILKKCYECLRPGGKLLLKEMDRSITWKFTLLYCEETLAVRVLGLTLGNKVFTFPDNNEIRGRLERAGFEVQEVGLDRGHFVPHRLWIGDKLSPCADISGASRQFQALTT
jgi:cyclopropane fatty-acyl-phospholipid synthase-like methyltransferase